MNNLKIGVVVVAFAAAGIIFWRTSLGDAAPPANVDTSTEWMCESCEHVFPLVSDRYAELVDRAGVSAPLHCASCDQQRAYRVATCPTCGGKYFPIEVPGHSGACPTCQPNAPVWNQPPAAGQRPTGGPTQQTAETPKTIKAKKRTPPRE